MKRVTVLLFALLVPIDTWAGKLHIRTVTLVEIAQRGLAVLGTVVSVHVSSRAVVKVKVKKIWRRVSDETLGNNPAVGEIHEFDIYTGGVWDDPGNRP